MTPDLDSLATALYVKTDDLLKDSPQLAPWRPAIGIVPQRSDAELVTLAMMQAMLGFTSEARWLRYAHAHLRHLFPYLPKQPGYNKRLRRAANSSGMPAASWPRTPRCGPTTCGWWTPRRSTAGAPVRPSSALTWPDGRSTGTAPATRASSGGLRLHLVCTLSGLSIAFALTGAKADERDTLLDIFATEPGLMAGRPGQTLIGDRNYFGREFETQLAELGIQLLRPARKGEAERAGSQLFKPLRQVIESINETFKGQLDLERRHGRTPGGVIVRVIQRILALTAAI